MALVPVGGGFFLVLPPPHAAPAAEPEKTEEAAPVPEAETAAEPETEEPWEPVTLKVGFLGKGIKPVGVIVAMAKGFYEEEGIIIDKQVVSSMNDAYLAVSKGDLDVYLFSSTAAATFISQGTTTLRVFGGTAGEGSEIMCDVNSDLKLDTLEDFVGKTVACMMPETGQMVLKNALLQAGYTIGGPDDKADVTFVYAEDKQEMVSLNQVPENKLSTGIYDGTVTYQTSDAKIATVDANGKLTVVKAAGVVTITASGAETPN